MLSLGANSFPLSARDIKIEMSPRLTHAAGLRVPMRIGDATKRERMKTQPFEAGPRQVSLMRRTRYSGWEPAGNQECRAPHRLG